MQTITADILKKVIHQRPHNSFKGTFGKVLIVGGNPNMGGAAIMAGSAAVHAGAGLVTIATARENLTAVHSVIPEAMFVDYHDAPQFISLIKGVDVIVLGPGLGNDSTAERVIQTVFANVAPNQTLIVDGSAITLVAQNAALKDAIPTNAHIIYTPHQMEWQRLSGIPISEQDNPHRNQEAQQRLNATVILKKHHSEIYFSSGEIRKLMVGGPAMATGGMGDTLTGILAAFIAQFNAPFEDRIQAAVFTHSKIADELAEAKYVVLPTDIISHLQSFMKKIVVRIVNSNATL
ncbi:NAD(P)H-hydrate dehydratase [Ligilactobacillus aviarius]|uniref:NAD(P)H-hydrate dehydratase n=1 Tax=Ligilactobacillus aviarius TaxID=1606 RepID=UPI00255B4D0C|nr:NAD(P)H-hydrate dehydratase [Ligilactobacillus aviarius]